MIAHQIKGCGVTFTPEKQLITIQSRGLKMAEGKVIVLSLWDTNGLGTTQIAKKR